jgi:hypothetical protein
MNPQHAHEEGSCITEPPSPSAGQPPLAVASEGSSDGLLTNAAVYLIAFILRICRCRTVNVGSLKLAVDCQGPPKAEHDEHEPPPYGVFVNNLICDYVITSSS